MIETYKELVRKMCDCELPLALKASAFNNMALAKILHQFYHTLLSEQQLDHMDNVLAPSEKYIIYPEIINFRGINSDV